jgi:hypothetical protein
MAKSGPPRRRPEAPSVAPTTITELARRYHSCAVALAKSLGLPMTEAFLRDHRESVSSIFIAADRAGVRLHSGVQLPPLADAPISVTTAPPANGRDNAEPVTDGVTTVTAPNGDPVVLREDRPPVDPSANGSVTGDVTAVTSPTTIPTAGGLPTSIPGGLQLPCAEALIADLRPAQLALLCGKVGLRALAEKSLEPLHVALLAERARRFEQGRKPTRVEGDGHGA